MGKITGLVFPSGAGEKKFVCPQCGKEYKNAESLEKHMAEKHTKAPDGE